jgi:undecaprenyl-diphosphatase
MGVPDGEHLLYFDLLCHAGTLLALLIYLRWDVWSVLKDVRKMGLYFLALAPLIPAYFLLKPLRVMASDPAYLGYAMMITAALLFAASKKSIEVAASPENSAAGTAATLAARDNEKSKRSAPTERHIPELAKGSEEDRFIEVAASPTAIKWGHVLCIGVMQTMALIPGISRSGSTIAAARFCGWEWREAARFSFLLAIPTILGGELLETLKGHGGGLVSPACYAGGFVASFALGLVAVRFIFWVYETGKVRPFAWYCLGVGLFAWTIFHG